MANIKSAAKQARKAVRNTAINRARMSRIRTQVKKIETAIESHDKKAAEAALKEAQPELHRGVSKGYIHRNTAARKLSRLSARIKAL